MRNLVITGLSLFLGISIPHFFNEYWNPVHHGLVHTNAGWVSHIANELQYSGCCVVFCLVIIFCCCDCLQFNAFLNTIFSSPATVGLIVAVFLDNTIEVEKAKKDRGMPWWVKFRTFRGDNRNEEFYTLPFNLNRFFPPTQHASSRFQESQLHLLRHPNSNMIRQTDSLLRVRSSIFKNQQHSQQMGILIFFVGLVTRTGPDQDCRAFDDPCFLQTTQIINKECNVPLLPPYPWLLL